MILFEGPNFRKTWYFTINMIIGSVNISKFKVSIQYVAVRSGIFVKKDIKLTTFYFNILTIRSHSALTILPASILLGPLLHAVFSKKIDTPNYFYMFMYLYLSIFKGPIACASSIDDVK
jgi:hypothetical protein